MAQGDKTGGAETWLGSACILKTGAIKFDDKLDIGYERRRRLKDDIKVFGLRSFKDEIVIC